MTKDELVARLFAVREVMEAPSSGIAEDRLERLIQEIENEERLLQEIFNEAP